VVGTPLESGVSGPTILTLGPAQWTGQPSRQDVSSDIREGRVMVTMAKRADCRSFCTSTFEECVYSRLEIGRWRWITSF